MKIAEIINNINQASKTKNYVDAYLLPIQDLSINYTSAFSIDDIKQIKTLNKEVFVILNKNIHNDELNKLENTLKQIETLI